MDNIATILVALFSGGALKYILDYMIQRRKMKTEEEEDTFTDLFKRIHKIYSILNTLQFHTNSHRVVIVKVEDSGGIPTLLTPLRSSVLYEVFADPLPSVKSLWHGLKVDEPYVKLLQQLYEEGNVSYNVEELPNYTDLKDIHEDGNTKCVESFFILREQRFFMYLSVHFYQYYCADVDRGSTYRNSIRTSIKDLRNLLDADELREADETINEELQWIIVKLYKSQIWAESV